MRPQDARRSLRQLWTRAKVQSCSDGSVRIVPTYRGIRPWNENEGGGAGLTTRMYAAYMVETVLGIKGRK